MLYTHTTIKADWAVFTEAAVRDITARDCQVFDAVFICAGSV